MAALSQNAHGEPPARPTVLRAGPLTTEFADGDLRSIRLGNLEVLRRIYVAVRDRNWGTVPFDLTNLDVRQEANRFTVAFDCRHQQGEIDFAWRATIRGEADGTLRFAMDGQARSTFMRNRIGICVLHPGVASGAPFTAELADGSLLAGTLPRAISPTTPVPPCRSLAHEVSPGLRAHLEFSGDRFEMEDQRNWTDASFKTYSTPLALPFPVEVRAGTVVRQAVTLTLRGAIPVFAPAPPLALTVTDTIVGPLPRLGLGMASHGQRLSSAEIARLRALVLAHVRVDLTLAQPGWRITLQRAITESQALGVALEVAIFLSVDVKDDLTALVAAMREARPRVASWLIFAHGDAPIDAPVIAAARRLLGAYDASAPIGAGTNGNFVQLNRNRPPVELLDLVCYSINPQVHAFDDRSIMETPEGQEQTVESARMFCGGLPLAITPVTLKPRFNPDATAPEPAAAPTELPSQVDARQATLFGAAWTVASLKRLAEAGAASVTYYETTGWRGVMETEQGSPLPERFPSIAGAVFPIYHVLADAGEWAGASVRRAVSSDPSRVDGLALERDGRRCVVLANVTNEAQEVVVGGIAEPRLVRLLDSATLDLAQREPDAFRQRRDQTRGADAGRSLTLRPYAVARIEGEAPNGRPAHV